jgi:hypothetical protein
MAVCCPGLRNSRGPAPVILARSISSGPPIPSRPSRAGLWQGPLQNRVGASRSALPHLCGSLASPSKAAPLALACNGNLAALFGKAWPTALILPGRIHLAKNIAKQSSHDPHFEPDTTQLTLLDGIATPLVHELPGRNTAKKGYPALPCPARLQLPFHRTPRVARHCFHASSCEKAATCTRDTSLCDAAFSTCFLFSHRWINTTADASC